MAGPPYSEAQLEAAVAALADPACFREAEAVVGSAAPGLARILARALEEGGWFAEGHAESVRRAAALPDGPERLAALRTLLAEEARLGMMVGVAVGWALAGELNGRSESG